MDAGKLCKLRLIFTLGRFYHEEGNLAHVEFIRQQIAGVGFAGTGRVCDEAVGSEAVDIQMDRCGFFLFHMEYMTEGQVTLFPGLIYSKNVAVELRNGTNS